MKSWRRWAAVMIAASWLFCAATASADTGESEGGTEIEQQQNPSGAHTLELGAQLRTDVGARPVRLEAGWRTPSSRALLAVDPFWWLDGRTTTDVLGFWRTGHFEPFAGWRLQTLPLVEGSQFQHNLVVGTALALPEFLDGRVGGQWGVEASTMMVKHGGGVAGDSFRADSGRHYIDRITFGMFARFYYNLEVRR